MPTAFFPLLGRLGNLLFIYCHARAWCEKEGYALSMYPWIGERIFQIPEAVRPGGSDRVFGEKMYQHQDDVNYTKKQVREWLKFQPWVEDKLGGMKVPEVLLDVRRGDDFIAAGLVCLNNQCYQDAAAKWGYDPATCEWEVFPDSPTRHPGFCGNVDACGLGTTEVSVPAFYRMTKAKVHFRANSTFSFFAATLGNAKVYAPVIKGMKGGVKDQYCSNFVEGNWPVMADCAQNSDIHIPDE